jgi:hypothetical protein
MLLGREGTDRRKCHLFKLIVKRIHVEQDIELPTDLVFIRINSLLFCLFYFNGLYESIVGKGPQGPLMGRRPISCLQGLAKLAHSANFLLFILNVYMFIFYIFPKRWFHTLFAMNNCSRKPIFFYFHQIGLISVEMTVVLSKLNFVFVFEAF